MTKKWLLKELDKIKIIDEPHEFNKFYYDEVIELVNKMPEKPILSVEVADYLEECWSLNLTISQVFNDLYTMSKLATYPPSYINKILQNDEEFARAYRNGYQLEKRKDTE